MALRSTTAGDCRSCLARWSIPLHGGSISRQIGIRDPNSCSEPIHATEEYQMIDLYFWVTPNGYKVSILLEELGWKYNVIPVNIGKGEQFQPDFLKISPNNRIPAMVDDEGPGGQ